MRWKPLDGRELPKCIAYPIGAAFVVMFSPLLLLMWLEAQKRKLIGPGANWSPWFAWYPVRSDRGFGSTVWLEWVERRVWYSDVEHRTLEEAKAQS
jgi:hypothetical protein